MRTGQTKSTLLARLERLEFRAAVSRKLKTRFGNLRRLPRDYTGERHLVIAKHPPSRFGQEWVEFEEVPGPDPIPDLGEYLNIPQHRFRSIELRGRGSQRLRGARMTLEHRGEGGMSNLSKRVRKLESQLTNITGLVARSDEWFAFWGDKIERLIAGEAPERVGRIPLGFSLVDSPPASINTAPFWNSTRAEAAWPTLM
jgi:hypothetical protein